MYTKIKDHISYREDCQHPRKLTCSANFAFIENPKSNSRDASQKQSHRLSTLCIPTWPLSPVLAGFFRGDFLLGGIFSFSSLSSAASSLRTRRPPAPGLESRSTCFLDNTA